MPPLLLTKPSLLRLSPESREALTAPARRRGVPLDGAKIDAVRALVETTPLSFREIARRTGTSLATVSRLTARRGWTRAHAEAPERSLSSAQRRARRVDALAEQVVALAEAAVERLQHNPHPSAADIHRAGRALALAKAVVGTRGGRPGRRAGAVSPTRS